MTERLKTTYGKYTVRFEGADPFTVIACFPLKTVAFPSRNDDGKTVSTSSGISFPKNPSAATSGKHAEYNSRRSKPDRQDLILRRAGDDSRLFLCSISMKSAPSTGQSAADSAGWLKLGATVGTECLEVAANFICQTPPCASDFLLCPSMQGHSARPSAEVAFRSTQQYHRFSAVSQYR